MIPQGDIIAWRRTAPWSDDGMVEQDLILTRALVDIFSDGALAQQLVFRGGTALQKLVLVPPRRYSEDIDLVQSTAGPIGPILTGIRNQLDPWLGTPSRDAAEATATLTYRIESEIPPIRPLRLKVEINTREHFAIYGYTIHPLEVISGWFTGHSDIRTFVLDELIATKLRALYQRRRGRDLFDLWDARTRGQLDPDKVVNAFHIYLERQGLRVTRAQFEQNFATKAVDKTFLDDVKPMLANEVVYDPKLAVELVRREFIERLPGEPWKGIVTAPK